MFTKLNMRYHRAETFYISSPYTNTRVLCESNMHCFTVSILCGLRAYGYNWAARKSLLVALYRVTEMCLLSSKTLSTSSSYVSVVLFDDTIQKPVADMERRLMYSLSTWLHRTLTLSLLLIALFDYCFQWDSLADMRSSYTTSKIASSLSDCLKRTKNIVSRL